MTRVALALLLCLTLASPAAACHGKARARRQARRVTRPAVVAYPSPMSVRPAPVRLYAPVVVVGAAVVGPCVNGACVR